MSKREIQGAHSAPQYEKAPITLALDLTWTTVNARLRNLKWTAFELAALLVVVPAVAVVFQSFLFLVGLFLLPLLGFHFAWKDQRLVAAWENRILDWWSHGDMPMAILVTTITLQPNPLQKSLREMFHLLPSQKENGAPSKEEAEKSLAMAAARQAQEMRRLARGFAFYCLGLFVVFGLAFRLFLSDWRYA